jgi:glycosyltransferase 2 family protein
MITIVLYYLSGINIQINIPYGKWAWIGIPMVYGLYLVVLKYFFKSFFKIHAGLFWWSLALQMMQFISALFILLAFHQSTDLYDYLFLFFISAIATALPITIGGLGAREMVFFYGAKFLSLNFERSISLSIMFLFLSAFLSIWGMYWVFFPPFRREPIPVKIKDVNPIETNN